MVAITFGILTAMVCICTIARSFDIWSVLFSIVSGEYVKKYKFKENSNKIVWFQEAFRYVIYRILRRTEQGLQAVAENTRITENKHILAYVSGMGFGVISGTFALVNVLADMVSIKYGSFIFFKL